MMQQLMMEYKLKEILNNMDLFQQSYPEDVCLVLADTEKVIAYLPGKQIDLRLEPGTRLSDLPNMVTVKALREGRIIREERGPELFGVPYVATSIPVLDQGRLVGAFSVASSNQKGDMLRKSYSEIVRAVEEMSSVTEQVTRASVDVVSRIEALSTESNRVSECLQNIQSILDFVNEVAMQSHILGLNAAIEAARAGEQGRGFSVVAEEMRKMADSSKKSVEDIKTQLETIRALVEGMNTSIHHITTFTEQHAASMEELQANFENLNHLAHDIQGIV